MRLLHALGRTRASFDDPDLVSRAGLVPQGSGVFRTYGGLSGMHGCGVKLRSCEHGHAT